MRLLNILIWHVHGSWSTAFVQGRHRYLLPTLPGRGQWGGGRPEAWDWPASAVEVPGSEIAEQDVDVAVLQRPEEVALTEALLGRAPGRDLPAVYVEHNTPPGPAATTVHPLAGRRDLLLVHVSAFNRLMWDSGSTPTEVVEHGIVDPGARYTGELAAAAVALNEPLRRGRVVGADLLPALAAAAPVHAFGMGTGGLGQAMGDTRIAGFGDLGQHRLHDELARRRVYLHTTRWTSLGLSLIEAMQLGMPVAVAATTAAPESVPAAAGICSSDIDKLVRGVRELVAEPELARRCGDAARDHALARHGLPRFLSRWDEVLDRAVHTYRRPQHPARAGRMEVTT